MMKISVENKGPVEALESSKAAVVLIPWSAKQQSRLPKSLKKKPILPLLHHAPLSLYKTSKICWPES
jgi:hypothetical protein